MLLRGGYDFLPFSQGAGLRDSQLAPGILTSFPIIQPDGLTSFPIIKFDPVGQRCGVPGWREGRVERGSRGRARLF